jgi:hypothetical protein
VNVELKHTELRSFGVVTGAITAILFGVVLPWLLGHAFPWWPWVVGGVLVLSALVFPAGLRPVYRIWMTFGHALGWINTRIILGFAYYAIVLPISVVMRLTGRDTMARGFEKESPSYRTPSTDLPKNHFERPF